MPQFYACIFLLSCITLIGTLSPKKCHLSKKCGIFRRNWGLTPRQLGRKMNELTSPFLVFVSLSCWFKTLIFFHLEKETRLMQCFSFPKLYNVCSNWSFCHKCFYFIYTYIYSLRTTGEKWQFWKYMKLSRFNLRFSFLIAAYCIQNVFTTRVEGKPCFICVKISVQGVVCIRELHCLCSFLHYFTPNYTGLPKKCKNSTWKFYWLHQQSWLSIKDKISKISICHKVAFSWSFHEDCQKDV